MKSANSYNVKSLVFFFLIILLNSTDSLGQTGNMQIETPVINFGKIASNSHAPKAIIFKNTSQERLAILIVEKSPDVKVQVPRIFFNPGEEGSIPVRYEPAQTGDFEEAVSIYTNLDDKPYSVILKGTTVSIEECFPDPRNFLKRSVEVIDIDTKEPLPQANLSFVHNFKYDNAIEFRVDKEGKIVKELPIGMYHIAANATGYEDFNEERYIPKSQPLVLIEMTSVKKAPVTPEPSQPISKTETIKEEPVQNINKEEIVITSVDLPENQYAANNLIFLLDVSTSMKSAQKFLLLKQSVNNLAMILRSIDNISVITYASEAQVILTGVNGHDKDKILESIQDLTPYGITKGVKGLQKAYDLAEKNFIPKGNNQIILMTDGEFSEKGITDEYYEKMLSGYAQQGISLSIIGFGINTEAINRMEMMSDAGKGSFILVNSNDFTKELLIDEVKKRSFIGE